MSSFRPKLPLLPVRHCLLQRRLHIILGNGPSRPGNRHTPQTSLTYSAAAALSALLAPIVTIHPISPISTLSSCHQTADKVCIMFHAVASPLCSAHTSSYLSSHTPCLTQCQECSGSVSPAARRARNCAGPLIQWDRHGNVNPVIISALQRLIPGSQIQRIWLL